MRILGKSILFIENLLCAYGAIFETSGFDITSILPKDGLSPVFIKDGCRFYEIEKVQLNRNPNTVELLNYVLSQEKITVSIGLKTFNLYPTKYLEVVKNGKSKILGYFTKIHANNDIIILRFKNGDSTVYGERYSSMVRISFGPNTFFKQLSASTPDKNNFEIKLSNPKMSYERTKLSIQCERPTIGTRLIKLLSSKLNVTPPKAVAPTRISLDTSLFNNGILNLKILKQLGENIIRNDKIQSKAIQIAKEENVDEKAANHEIVRSTLDQEAIDGLIKEIKSSVNEIAEVDKEESQMPPTAERVEEKVCKADEDGEDKFNKSENEEKEEVAEK